MADMGLGEHFADCSRDGFVLAIGEEIFLELLAADCALQEILIEVGHDVDEVSVRHLLHGVEDQLVALDRDGALGGITLTAFAGEELLEHVTEIELSAPAEAFGIRNCDRVAVVDLAKKKRICRVLNVTADHARERVAGQHGALACTTAGDDEVNRAGIQQYGGQNPVLDIGQGVRVLSAVHAVVEDFVAQRLDDGLECVENKLILCGLAVLGN